MTRSRAAAGLDDLVAGLADAFAAPAGLAGCRLQTFSTLCAPGGGQPPWERGPDLATRLQRETSAVVLDDDPGRATVVSGAFASEGAGLLLWLDGQPGRAWAEGERSALALAALALLRLAEANPWGRWLERARQQQRLEEAALVAGRLAHDFGNVLTGILGFTELSMPLPMPAGSVLPKYLQEIHQSSQLGAQFLSQLNQFSKRGPARAGATPLAGVVATEQARWRSAWENKIAFRADLAPGLPLAKLHPDTLGQLLGRLLENATDALKTQGGTITLTARPAELTAAECLGLLGNATPGPHLALTLADNGPGFSDEARQRVFNEPFFSTKPRHRGLGLAIVYGIHQGHGGGFTLDHPAGGGAAIRVYLPAAPPPVQPAQQAPASLVLGARVLVVDDDPLTLRLMCTTLERAGYRVQGAATAQQALDSYAREPFALVLSDVMMPRMTGLDLARQLLGCDPNLNLLFISGQVPPGVNQDTFAGRDFDLLPKPFRPEGLLRAVRLALERPRRAGAAPGLHGG